MKPTATYEKGTKMQPCFQPAKLIIIFENQMVSIEKNEIFLKWTIIVKITLKEQ